MTEGPSSSGPLEYVSMVDFLETNKNLEVEGTRVPKVEPGVHPEHQQQSFPQNSPPPQQTAACEAPSTPDSLPAEMVYQRADPQPFMPPGFQRVAVQGRDQMVRAVISRPLARHEDIAIVTIEDMP